MGPSTETEVAGKIHEVKGRVTNDPSLEGKGAGEKIAGTIQNKIGHVQKVVEKP
jgi:uncharacterized protein YjbJ (UPF0337 family)